MAINKPVKKGTAQRPGGAKGLLEKVGKTGDYKTKKTLNLTNKQLGARGRKAATSGRVAISGTHYDATTKKVYGPGGQLLTGRVDLGGGNIGVYKNGVRVKAASAKPKGGTGGGGGGDGGGGPTKDKIKDTPTYSPPNRLGKPGEYQAGKGQYVRPDPGKLTPRQIASARRGEAADKRVGGNGTSRSGLSASTIRATGKGANISNGKPPYKLPRINPSIGRAANATGPNNGKVADLIFPVQSAVVRAVKSELARYTKIQNDKQVKRDKMGLPRENPRGR